MIEIVLTPQERAAKARKLRTAARLIEAQPHFLEDAEAAAPEVADRLRVVADQLDGAADG